MGLRFLEHFLILTEDPEGTRDWWCNALGFREGDHPDFGFPVHWLYIGDQDVVHIGKTTFSSHQNTYLETPSDSDANSADGRLGSGRIDHVCFNCDNMPETITRLEAHDIAFNERQAVTSPVYQFFFRDPINGIKIELNFSREEALSSGRIASWTTAGDGG